MQKNELRSAPDMSTETIRSIRNVTCKVNIAVRRCGASSPRRPPTWRAINPYSFGIWGYHAIRRFTTCTDSAAAPRSTVEALTFRAVTRTLLFDQTWQSSTKAMLLVSSEASAKSPCRAPATGPVPVLCRSFDHILCSKGDEP